MALPNTRALRAQVETINAELVQAERQLEKNYRDGIFGQDARALKLAQRVALLEKAALNAAMAAVKAGDMKLAMLAASHSGPALEYLTAHASTLRHDEGFTYHNPRPLRRAPPRRNPRPAFDPEPDALSMRQGQTLLALWPGRL